MRALARVVGLSLTFGWSVSCGSSTQTVTSPSTVKCQVTAAAEPAAFAATGGAGTLTVTANRDCLWNAAASGNWIQLGPQSSGQGNAAIGFSVTTNPDPAQRRGAIAIGDHQVAITQEAACIFTVSPLNDSVSPDGERRTINVTASGAQCSWSARTETEWLAIVEGSQGSGSGQVVYEARRTTGPSRSGELTVAGQRVIVTQGVGCSVAIAPTTQTISAGGGVGSIGVTTAAGCPWSAQSDTEWISITSARSGTGPATVTFSVGASDGPRRTGTLRVGPQVFTVTQNSGCRFGISPESFSVSSAGGSGGVAVTTVTECGWTATSNAAWITITGGGSQSGNGSVQFTVAATTGPARIGTLTVAGHAFGVSQGSGCSFSISPASQTIPSHGGPGSVAVNTSPGCPWTAAAAAPWARITSGQSGAGPGTVAFTVDGTPTSQPRSTSLSIAGQTFTINQDGAPCLYVVSPAAVALEAGGGSGVFEVNTPEGCGWTAASNDGWLRVTAGTSGSGDGAVSFTADANPGPPRTGTIVAGGRLFTASQAGAGAVTLAPRH
jgi:Putative binding domain, N-terminal/Viral BACON domain